MDTALPKDEGQPYVYQEFPFQSSKGDETKVFHSEAEIPKGWTLPNGKAKGGDDKPKTPATPVTSAPTVVPADGQVPGIVETDSTQVQQPNAPEVDSAGTPWNPDLHAATKTTTKNGLWRMKVGVSRPEGQETPKTLDL